MKKIATPMLTFLLLISLGACTENQKESSKGSEETSMSSQNDQATDDTFTSKKKENAQSIFTAILTEDAKENDTKDQSIRLVLKEVKAIEDPEKIIAMMENDGVILNVVNEQLADGINYENLKKGDNIRCTLVGLPAMTRSIPPQIAGNSVIKVEKI
ncbi:hypothetical protein [Candidatus Enterococcus mansonii]|uniref:Lipoprotein n=1 Tax=Candidatus Enterococcus mansonii TaxID=1834181 RepID=A0A242CJT3_9ENTE|nr:hypothetical protein [Enterococcus sp. 4G2_DIV0659]OTO10170.1 hypothetical protein A5880_000853 [Enterococcus sp. 4G2_DIV0659]